MKTTFLLHLPVLAKRLDKVVLIRRCQIQLNFDRWDLEKCAHLNENYSLVIQSFANIHLFVETIFWITTFHSEYSHYLWFYTNFNFEILCFFFVINSRCKILLLSRELRILHLLRIILKCFHHQLLFMFHNFQNQE